MLQKSLLLIFLCTSIISYTQSDDLIGGRCEGCEAIFENKVPFDKLGHELKLPTNGEKGSTLTVTGRVFKSDGKTPAPGVILYVYHTDQQGKYTALTGAKGWEKRHGSIRGWLKTNQEGEYIIHTLKPAPYPGASIPAHIHIFLKEPGNNPYWVEEYQFQGDPFLKPEDINKSNPRGGQGILKTTLLNGELTASRDIVLGLNIPNYR